MARDFFIHETRSQPLPQPQPPFVQMSAEDAAKVLSSCHHRGEYSWWIESTQHFRNGRASEPQITVRSNTACFNVYEAIAVAWTYRFNAFTGEFSDVNSLGAKDERGGDG